MNIHKLSKGFRLATAWTCLLGADPSFAQISPATLPDLRLSGAGFVRAIALQTDGKIIIGGEFTAVNDVRRNNLARINPNGTVDLTWSPDADGTVGALALKGTEVFVGGGFTMIGGRNRHGLAKISTTGGGEADASWDPNPDSRLVTAMAVAGTNVYVGGGFRTIGGLEQPGLAKLDAGGMGFADPTWAWTITDNFGLYPIGTLAINGNDLYAAGEFTEIGGIRRTALVKLQLGGAGTLDLNWDPGLERFDSVAAIAVSGTNLFVSGRFRMIGGQSRRGLAKLSTIGSGLVDPIWNPVCPDYGINAQSLTVSGTNLYLAASPSCIDGKFTSLIAKLSALGNGRIDPFWSPNFYFAPGSFGSVYTILVNEGSIYIGGNFTLINGSVSLGLAKLDSTTGAPDGSFPVAVQSPGEVYAIAQQPDGKIIVGGNFWFAGGLPRRHLARMNRDGKLDLTWSPGANDTVTAVATTGTDVYVAGYFTQIGGQNRSGLAKLSTIRSDEADPLWNPQLWDPRLLISGSVHALAVSGNSVFVGGDLLATNRPYLAKLSGTGTGAIDPLWNPSPNNRVFALVPDGADIYVGGSFSNMSGQNVGGLARLGTAGTGAPDPAWRPNLDAVIYCIALGESNLYAGSIFYPVAPYFRITKLSKAGTGQVDISWNVAASDSVRALALSGTNLYAGGWFTSIGGQMRNNLAKISATGTGTVDPTWDPHPDGFGPFLRLLATNGTDVYVTGSFTTIGSLTRYAFAFLPVADAPSIGQDPLRLLILSNRDDGPEVTHFRITGLSGVSLFQSDGLTPVRVGDFISVEQGGAGLRYTGTGVVTVVSALNDTPAGAGTGASTVNLSAPQPPVFRFASANYSINEGSGFVVVTLRKIGISAASVSYRTANGSALGASDYQLRMGTFNFAADQTITNITIGIVNDFDPEGDEVFGITLTGSSTGAGIVYPGTATITIVDNDAVGLTSSLATNQLPNPVAPPQASGVLVVTLNVANGQWRLIGDDAWHDSGTGVTGLTGGNYELEFRRLLGYRAPGKRTVKVENAQTNSFPLDVYFSEGADGNGHLRVVILPTQVANNVDPARRGGWRLQSQANGLWRESGDTIVDLPAGYHAVQFKAVTNWAAPTPREVKVVASQPSEIGEEYVAVNTTEGLFPQVLSLAEATTTAPYLYNGQIRTPLGFGSGVVVKERVVLTAAHVLFDYRVLTFVPYTEVRWLFRKHKGEYEPVPQTPRGWYTRDGYAALRQASSRQDLSSPEVQHLDVAAMYFVATDTSSERPGGGGYGGYLTSDDDANEWLVLGDRLKMLVGYPLDGISEANRGKMHATPPTNASFTKLYSNLKVFGTPDLRSYGGNSGGPLYVQYDDGQFYPAGIYLGRSGQAIVRAIDSDVTDLINRAEDSGQGSGNHTGGGVARWESGVTGSPWLPGLFRVNFLPADAMVRGAGWRVAGADDPTWISDTNLYYPLIPGQFNIEFKPISGYSAPVSRRVEMIVDQTTPIDALYGLIRLSNLRKLGHGSVQMTLSGGTGRVYWVQTSSNLLNWADLLSLTNLNGTVAFTNSLAPGQRFYRAREVDL